MTKIKQNPILAVLLIAAAVSVVVGLFYRANIAEANGAMQHPPYMISEPVYVVGGVDDSSSGQPDTTTEMVTPPVTPPAEVHEVHKYGVLYAGDNEWVDNREGVVIPPCNNGGHKGLAFRHNVLDGSSIKELTLATDNVLPEVSYAAVSGGIVLYSGIEYSTEMLSSTDGRVTFIPPPENVRLIMPDGSAKSLSPEGLIPPVGGSFTLVWLQGTVEHSEKFANEVWYCATDVAGPEPVSPSIHDGAAHYELPSVTAVVYLDGDPVGLVIR